MNRTAFSIVLIALIALSGCGERSSTKEIAKELPIAQSNNIDESKIVDLTYNFDETTVYWPTAYPFHWEKESWGYSKGGYWYTAGRYAASEHGGTHLDSPIHFGEGKSATDQISLARLVGPAIVIDISLACAKDADYRLTTDDITEWEKSNGRIPDESIVLVHT
ncbi:MAG: cyclase family protein, partial [Acidobacteria bacterium]|nr:cyclase family protein [Acidobacteriota bacterium]